MKKLTSTLLVMVILFTCASTVFAHPYKTKTQESTIKTVRLEITDCFYDRNINEYEFSASNRHFNIPNKKKVSFVGVFFKGEYNKKLDILLKKSFIGLDIIMKYDTLGTKDIYDDVILDWNVVNKIRRK